MEVVTIAVSIMKILDKLNSWSRDSTISFLVSSAKIKSLVGRVEGFKAKLGIMSDVVSDSYLSELDNEEWHRVLKSVGKKLAALQESLEDAGILTLAKHAYTRGKIIQEMVDEVDEQVAILAAIHQRTCERYVNAGINLRTARGPTKQA